MDERSTASTSYPFKKPNAAKKQATKSMPALAKGATPAWTFMFGPRIARRSSDDSLRETGRAQRRQGWNIGKSNEPRRSSIESFHPPGIGETGRSFNPFRKGSKLNLGPPKTSVPAEAVYQEVANAIQMGNYPSSTNTPSTPLSSATHQTQRDSVQKEGKPPAVGLGDDEVLLYTPTQVKGGFNSILNDLVAPPDASGDQPAKTAPPFGASKPPILASISANKDTILKRPTESPLAHTIPVCPDGLDEQRTARNLLVVCGAACFGIGAMGGSVAWAGILLACSVWLLARRARIDREALQHQLDRHAVVQSRLASGGETSEWLNIVFEQIWGSLDPMHMTSLVDAVEDSLAAAMPRIYSTHVQDVELGTQAPRITSIHVFPRTVQDRPDELFGEIAFELHAYPHPPHLLLHLCMGAGAPPLPVKVQLLKFGGKARFRLQATATFFSALDFAFVWLPDFDLAVAPLGLLDLMSLPMLSHYIKDSVGSALQRLVEPRSFRLDLDAMLSGPPPPATVGILQMHLRSAAYLAPDDLGSNINVTCAIEHGKALGTTRTVASKRPRWDETMFVPVSRVALENDLDLLVQIWDSAVDRSKLLGEVRFRLRDVVELATAPVFDGDVDLSQQHQAQERGFTGTLSMKMDYSPLADHLPEEGCPALLCCSTYQAVDIELGPAYGDSARFPNPYAVLYVDDAPSAVTRTKFNNPAPHWNAVSEHFVRNWQAATITIVVKSRLRDERDPVVGVAKVDVGSLCRGGAPEHAQWYPLQGGAGFGRVRFGVSVRPLAMQLPPRLAGSHVGTLVIDSLSVTASHCMGTQESFYVHAQLETGGAAHQATQQALNSPYSIRWDEDQLIFPVEDRHRNTLALSLRQKTLFTGDKLLKVCRLPLADLLDGQVQTLAFDLEDRHVTSSLHLRVVPLAGTEEKLTLSFRTGFFPGLSHAHHAHFASHLPGLDPRAMIREANLAWSVPAQDSPGSTLGSNSSLDTCATFPRLRSHASDEMSPDEALPKASRSATLRHLIQKKVLDLTTRAKSGV